jgi:hypothetical protein
MNQLYCLDVADGFRLAEDRQLLDMEQARLLLRTKRQRRYTFAKRIGEQALLVRHKLVCPCCGHSVPAYEEFLTPKFIHTDRIPRTVIDEWADPQTRFFDDERSVLVFHEVHSPGTLTCPRCGRVSTPYTQMNTIRIGIKKQNIIITCDKASLELLFSAPSCREIGTVHLPLPLMEQLTFNLRNGHTVLRLCGSDGSDVSVLDVAPGSKDWRNSVLYGLLTAKTVCRRLLRVFASMYGARLPYTRDTIVPEGFLLMTLFRGYSSHHFFDAIPYGFSTETIDRSFRTTVKRLHNARNLPAIYAASKLPQSKSIKRLFFSSQGLFFYLAEAELLWQIVGDVNSLRSLLELSHVFEILSFLHQCPASAAFLQDYTRIKGVGSLVSRMEQNWTLIMSLSTQYAAMSESARKTQRQEWQKTGLAAQLHMPYSLPMQAGNRTIKDCTIDGYRFSWLHTKNEYRQAGLQLNNCLQNWEADCNPVIVVKRGKTYKAAIEMNETLVLQALASHNDPMELDLRLWKAFCKWLDKYSLAPPLDLNNFDDLNFLF